MAAPPPPAPFTAPSPTAEAHIDAAAAPQSPSLFKRPLFWVIAGSVLLLAGTGIAVAATHGKEKDPVATWGGIGLRSAP